MEAKVRMIAPKPPVDGCQPNPCLNGGTCSPTPSGYMCYCDEGYKGDTCEGKGYSSTKIVAVMVSNESDAKHNRNLMFARHQKYMKCLFRHCLVRFKNNNR